MVNKFVWVAIPIFVLVLFAVTSIRFDFPNINLTIHQQETWVFEPLSEIPSVCYNDAQNSCSIITERCNVYGHWKMPDGRFATYNDTPIGIFEDPPKIKYDDKNCSDINESFPYSINTISKVKFSPDEPITITAKLKAGQLSKISIKSNSQINIKIFDPLGNQIYDLVKTNEIKQIQYPNIYDPITRGPGGVDFAFIPEINGIYTAVLDTPSDPNYVSARFGPFPEV